MKRMNTEEGFTGLEAAIVLIAFVVVAAVFSYVVLGAGFFTTQKAQEVVYTSVDQASSSVEILGQVYGYGNETGAPPYTKVDRIQFKVGLTAGGSPVDFSMTTLTFSTNKDVYRLDLNKATKADREDIGCGQWGVVEIFNAEAGSDDLLLENQEQFVILARTEKDKELVANEPFNLEIRPSVGASYAISKKITPSISAVNVLN
ncbi:archaellin/type IV pilin N-terminal domain-containing protein [Methanomicrobium mobile]|uniref:archaellin/type IV pilin N-terminal domain-containing protein n=1 Tax=Methanomicrobium mobile TaxID=2205 RepID=UPI0005B2E506|nr:archaellin/type IV pilin N-terminal domain-containing protein [Methanomicrobium mobile]